MAFHRNDTDNRVMIPHYILLNNSHNWSLQREYMTQHLHYSDSYLYDEGLVIMLWGSSSHLVNIPSGFSINLSCCQNTMDRLQHYKMIQVIYYFVGKWVFHHATVEDFKITFFLMKFTQNIWSCANWCRCFTLATLKVLGGMYSSIN